MTTFFQDFKIIAAHKYLNSITKMFYDSMYYNAGSKYGTRCKAFDYQRAKWFGTRIVLSF